jgi:hypothetical protein
VIGEVAAKERKDRKRPETLDDVWEFCGRRPAVFPVAATVPPKLLALNSANGYPELSIGKNQKAQSPWCRLPLRLAYSYMCRI